MTKALSSASGLMLALGSASFYGLNIVYARLASFDGVSGTAIVIYRVVLMLAIVGLGALVARRSLAVVRHERGTLLVLGLASAVQGLCYLSSVAFIPVTVAAVIFYTFPVLIVLTSPFVDGTRLTPALAGVAALACLGVTMVVGPAFDGLDWRGLALAFGASLSTVVQFFAAARCRRTPLVAKIFWINVLVLPTALAVGLAAGRLDPPSALLASAFPVAMTIAGYMAGFLLQLLALGRVSAAAAGILFCTEPVVAAVSSASLLGETLTPLQMTGGALVLAAIAANILVEQRVSKAPPLVPIAD